MFDLRCDDVDIFAASFDFKASSELLTSLDCQASVRRRVMRAIAQSMGALAVGWLLGVTVASAQQPAIGGCTTERASNGAQTVRCAGGVTIVAEDGAQY